MTISPCAFSDSAEEINFSSVKASEYLSYDEFKTKFSLGGTSTEKDNPRTAQLSTTLFQDRQAGLEMLLSEEERVIVGFREFAPQLDPIAKALAEKTKRGGRIIFIGVGSSGRAGIDLAAKATTLCPQLKCLGMMGGGDCALIQAREGFEDSPEEGRLAAVKLEITALDSVFLISASGSASFNAGFGHAAASAGANTYCFYNSTDVPERTSSLFKRSFNPVVPLLLDIGPQTIIGSTRLQGYSLARICLGYMLGQTILHLEPHIDPAKLSVDYLAEKLTSSLAKIKATLPDLAKIIDAEHHVFSSPQSNFRRVRDETQAGYVTLLGTASSAREQIIDSVETSPTFFLNPRKREQESHKRRAEYQAYLVGESDNNQAWKLALGREPYFPEDREEIHEFVLSTEVTGNESFEKRPHGDQNFVLGVEVLHQGETISAQLLEALTATQEKGGKTALIVISETPLRVDELKVKTDAVIFIQQEDDLLGLTFSQLLKWELNLISNSAMVLMGKVSGNRMIDLRTSNNKLIDRCMRLIHERWNARHPHETLDNSALYDLIIQVYEKQKVYQERGEYTPSTLKMVLVMLEKQCTFEEAIIFLRDINENIDRF